MPGSKGLDIRAGFTLIGELDDAVAHTRAALRSLQSLRHNVEDYTTVLTLGSIAAEKTLKIALGLHHLDLGEPWPTTKTMKAHGHDVVGLWTEVRSIYLKRLDAGGGTPYARIAVEAADMDPVARPMLAALSNWGTAGRFHRLDALAGQPQPGVLPTDLLEDTEAAICAHDPSIINDLGQPDAYDHARARMNIIMVESLRGWWKAHVDAWASGLLGQDARVLSAALRRVLKD